MPYTISEENDKIFNFLKVHPVAAVATATTSGVPHIASVYVSVDDSLNLYFITKTNTTKAKNILSNANVALSITDASALKTVQVLGTAQKIEDPNLTHQILTKVTSIAHSTAQADTPPLNKLAAGDYIAFVVHPSSMRLAEFIKPLASQSEGIFDEAQLGN